MFNIRLLRVIWRLKLDQKKKQNQWPLTLLFWGHFFDMLGLLAAQMTLVQSLKVFKFSF